jgi:membrane protein
MKIKSLWPLLKDAASGWSANDASTLGAALAYYTVFALAPLLVIVIAIAGLAFGQDVAQQHVTGQV